MTTLNESQDSEKCPAENVLKVLSGKWKGKILRLAVDNQLRFNTLLRQLPGSSKQSLALALKELEEAGILFKRTIKLKPLHIEYTLTDKGRDMIPVFKMLEGFEGR